MADKRKVITRVIIGVVLVVNFLAFLILAVYAVVIVAGLIRENIRTSGCIYHQKQIAIAVAQYLQDHSDFLPPASLWSDKVRPYLLNDSLFVCPSAKQLECGYAFYRPLSSRKVSTLPDPYVVPMLFDSSKGEFNYADEGQSLDFRHSGSIITFVDGHVQFFGGTVGRIILRKPP
jgi:prepilin-type processing-associated H-X9-DG protein